MRSVSIRKQTTTISTVENIFLFFCIIYTVFQLVYGKNSLKKTIESSKQAHNAKKIEFVKNRTIRSNLQTFNTSVTPKVLKNQDNVGNLYIILCKTFRILSRFCEFSKLFYQTQKFLFFSKIKSSITQHDPKGLLGTNTN